MVVGTRGAGGGSAWRARDGLGRVVLEERLQEHAHGAEHADEDEDPQEEAVDNHGHVLPVLAHLWTGRSVGGRWRGGKEGEKRLQ